MRLIEFTSISLVTVALHAVREILLLVSSVVAICDSVAELLIV